MRERMRKLTAAILMLVMVSVMFTACGSNSSDKSDNATQESTSAYVSEDIKVAALKGPTAIGMVKLMSDNEYNKTANNYTFQIEAAADAFTADLIKGDVQIAAMPCNAAATLYNKSNGKVSVVGINTLGVLYILDNKGEVTNVSDLKGRTIYTTGKGTTPEYTLRYLLNTNGIDPDKDVHIEFKSEASEVAAIMASAKEETVAMLPQPFATTVLMNNKEARIALDVTKEWENVSKDGSTVVTGVIVVNTEYYNNHKAAVDKFLEEYKLSADYVNANVDEVSTLVEKYGITKAAVAKQAIPKCNITIITARRLFTLNTRQNILTDIHINYNKKGNSYRIIISTDFSANELPFYCFYRFYCFNYASFLYILFVEIVLWKLSTN